MRQVVELAGQPEPAGRRGHVRGRQVATDRRVAMHGQMAEADFLRQVAGFLCGYYALLAVANLIAAAVTWRGHAGRPRTMLRMMVTAGWLALAFLLGLMAGVAASGDPHRLQWLALPLVVRDGLDQLLGPATYMLGTAAMLALCYGARRWFALPAVGWWLLNVTLLWFGLSLTDPDFAAIVSKPDNVPIVGMIFLLGFFTWVATFRAVQNDERQRQSLPTQEELDQDKVLVWPDLVYIELICMVAVTALLIVWSLVLDAPLEEPANVVRTPNPSKAPWYFLGLQELLVYFDPWLAGVVLPALIILGLCAVPYLDRNPAGNGYYTIERRRFAYLVFQVGFLVLWVNLIVVGTFMRGPNWNFFGLYETWDVHKVVIAENVELSEFFWVDLLGRPRPQPPPGAAGWTGFGYLAWREWPGLLLLTICYAVSPWLLARTTRLFGLLSRQLGQPRYVLLMFLLVTMALLLAKMLLRWSFNFKYFVSMPEWMLSF